MANIKFGRGQETPYGSVNASGYDPSAAPLPPTGSCARGTVTTPCNQRQNSNAQVVLTGADPRQGLVRNRS